VKYFNSGNLLPILVKCLDVGVFGVDTAIAVGEQKFKYRVTKYCMTHTHTRARARARARTPVMSELILPWSNKEQELQITNLNCK